MPNAVQRLHYFDQQFLRAADFTAEQDYHVGLRRAHNRSVHGWGIASGLAVDLTPPTSVTVRAGYALDSAGREIVLTEDVVLDLQSQTAGAPRHCWRRTGRAPIRPARRTPSRSSSRSPGWPSGTASSRTSLRPSSSSSVLPSPYK